MEQDAATRLGSELELIEASLLPAETLAETSASEWPRTFTITSTESSLSIHVSLSQTYPDRSGVHVEVKSNEDGRQQAEDRISWADQRMEAWDPDEDYPLYQLLTTHFLPLLAHVPASAEAGSSAPDPAPRQADEAPHHCLLTSHHLLSPSKRKDLIALSSQLSLVGFAKTGHPGIMYAIGSREDLEEWQREVKSWNWLALRVRVAPEPIPAESAEDAGGGRGSASGARGGKGRGEWAELEKLSDALEWMRIRGRERLLLDVGMGSGKG